MRVLVVGAGKLGSLLAKRLSEKGHEVIVIDKDENRARQIAEQADVEAYARDATDPSVYEEVNIATVDAVLAVTNKDEVNLFIAMMAREYGVQRIIVKVRDSRIAQIASRIGIAEHVVVEPKVVGSVIEGVLEGKYSAVDLVPVFAGNYRLVSITISEGSSVEGRLLEEIDYPREAARIISVFDGESFHDPGEIIRLRSGYQIIALVREDKLDEFIRAFK
jgi:trk system potassium uptake protein TrkA